MSDQTPVPADSPLMKAWEAYKRTEDFRNSRTWACILEHTEGSLWAAFVQGWEAASALAAPWREDGETLALLAAVRLERAVWTNEHKRSLAAEYDDVRCQCDLCRLLVSLDVFFSRLKPEGRAEPPAPPPAEAAQRVVSAHPEFEVWWEQFGEALRAREFDGRMLAYAAWAVATDRARQASIESAGQALSFAPPVGEPAAPAEGDEVELFVRCETCGGTGYITYGDEEEDNCAACGTSGFAPYQAQRAPGGTDAS